MRILIIGEYSSFANNLCNGFRELGHYTFVFNWGDGLKNIKQDYDSYTVNVTNYSICGIQLRGSHRLRRFISTIKLFSFIRSFKNNKFDVILIMNEAFVDKGLRVFNGMFNKKMVCDLARDYTQIYLLVCGDGYLFPQFLSNKKYISETLLNKYDIRTLQRKFNIALSLAQSKVIPTHYDYADCCRQYKKLYPLDIKQTIQLPIVVNKHRMHNLLNDKFVIYYGKNRAAEKGGYFIENALYELEKKYPELVEVCVRDLLPLDEYLSIIKRTNILMDQCSGYSYGMAALYGLAMGKIVCSNNELECQLEYKRHDIPIISINPNVSQIYAQIEKLILNPDLVKSLAIQSRKFVEEFHDSKIVAELYMSVFTSNKNE